MLYFRFLRKEKKHKNNLVIKLNIIQANGGLNVLKTLPAIDLI